MSSMAVHRARGGHGWPWVTLGLVLACVLAFYTAPTHDRDTRATGLEQYLAQGLDRYEAPAYGQYLNRTAPLSDGQRRAQRQALAVALAENDRQWLALHMAPDREFQRYLSDHRHLYLTRDEGQRWQQAREQVNQGHLEQTSAALFGFIPASPWSHGLFTHAFVNEDASVLLLQLVLLALLGIALERALGSVRFLLAAMVVTGASALGYGLFTLNPETPMTGAAGLVAGCLGLYLGLHGAYRLRHFLSLWVLVPVWMLAETWRWGDGGAASADLAVSGFGLATGLLLLTGLRRRPPVRDGDRVPKAEIQFRRDYAQLLHELANVDLAAANTTLKTLNRRYPRRPELLEQSYQLAKLQPGQPAYQTWSLRLMEYLMRQGYTESLLNVWQEYQRLASQQQPLPVAWHYRVLVVCVRELRLAEADRVFEALRNSAADDEQLAEACELLCQAHQQVRRSVSGSRARYYRRLLAELGEPRLLPLN